MKNLILAGIAVLFTTVGFSQKLAVPAAVKNAFAKKYPSVKKVTWENENGNYEAEFTFNKTETSVVMDARGAILETENEIAVTQLPKGVSQYIMKNYKNQKIKEASKIIGRDGKTTFEAEIKGMDLIFDANGNFVKAEKKDKADMDKEGKEDKD